VLELAVLGVLHDAPMHGYELRKRLTGLLGTFRACSFGSLYPTLRRLQRSGFIVEEDASAAEVPAGRNAGWSYRGRRVYRLTADGKERFAILLADAGPQTWEDSRPRCGYESWRAGGAGSRNVARACAPRWPAPGTRSTATPSSFTGWVWRPASARCAGSMN